MKRYGQLIGLKPEHYEMYKAYHARVWPEVLDTIRKCNIRNYSIFHHHGLLFAYFEYHGSDYAGLVGGHGRSLPHGVKVVRHGPYAEHPGQDRTDGQGPAP